jgi:hypothetical protein
MEHCLPLLCEKGTRTSVFANNSTAAARKAVRWLHRTDHVRWRFEIGISNMSAHISQRALPYSCSWVRV